jgi:predicted transposase/invertase (TIGR01784 family)
MIELDNIYYKNPHPHDRFFKESLAHLDIAQDLVRNALPEKLLKITDLQTLKPEKANFIDSVIGEKVLDALFSVKIAGEDGFAYFLCEHQSSVDEDMSFRLLKYRCAIYDYHRKTHKKDKYLPLVHQFVVYNGVAKYVAPLDIFQLFRDSELGKELFLAPHHLIDLQRLRDEELRPYDNAKVMLYILKHIFDDDLLAPLEKIVDDLQQQAKEKFIYIKSIFEYSVCSGQTEKPEELVRLFKKITPDGSEGGFYDCSREFDAKRRTKKEYRNCSKFI